MPKETDQEEYDRKQSELQADRDKHIEKVGRETERISSVEDTERQLKGE